MTYISILYKYQYLALSSINVVIIIITTEELKSCFTYLQSTVRTASIWYQRTLTSNSQDSGCQRKTSENSLLIKFKSNKQHTFFKCQRKIAPKRVNRRGRLYS